MRSEPGELKLNASSTRSKSRRAPAPAVMPFCSVPGVIDEAFADLQDLRSEPPESETAASSAAAGQQQALVATLVTQLEALDRQRQQLAQLLEGIDSSLPVASK